MCCVDVCVKESSYERESGERKVSWSVFGGALLPPFGFFFLVPFAPKAFLVSSRVVCVFFASSMFLLESLRVASKRTLGDQQFLIRIEKSASNAEKL